MPAVDHTCLEACVHFVGEALVRGPRRALVWIDDNGYVAGRLSDMIIRRGSNISPPRSKYGGVCRHPVQRSVNATRFRVPTRARGVESCVVSVAAAAETTHGS